MKLFRVGALALGVWAACGPVLALESYVLYDDLQGASIDPNRWGDPVNLVDLDRSLMLSSKTLRFVQRDWGATSSDSGAQSLSRRFHKYGNVYT